jgi:glycine dehydrogenase subunit 1
MPGRLVGRTKDARGNGCYTLTLAAREQHIRRERASSNICSNEGLCAVAVAIWLSLLGRDGFSKLARYNHHRAEALKSALAAKGLGPAFSGPTFNEFAVRLRGPAAPIAEAAAAAGVLPGLPLGRFYPELSDCLLVAVTEQRTDADFDRLVAAL